MYPDIIIHKRKTNKNLLVLEFKKTSSRVSDKKDFMKLREYQRQLGYKHALFIEFGVGYGNEGISRVEWISP
ncbi:hypothetical protein [Aliamphritea spongicola]|nr:hypothetical protein [Aliamphritea spongicola]